MTRMATPKIAGTLLIVGMLAVLIGVGTFRGNFAFATKGDNGGNNNNGNDNHDDNTINGNKADPPGSDAGCTGNPHDFSQPRAIRTTSAKASRPAIHTNALNLYCQNRQ